MLVMAASGWARGFENAGGFFVAKRAQKPLPHRLLASVVISLGCPVGLEWMAKNLPL